MGGVLEIATTSKRTRVRERSVWCVEGSTPSAKSCTPVELVSDHPLHRCPSFAQRRISSSVDRSHAEHLALLEATSAAVRLHSLSSALDSLTKQCHDINPMLYRFQPHTRYEDVKTSHGRNAKAKFNDWRKKTLKFLATKVLYMATSPCGWRL